MGNVSLYGISASCKLIHLKKNKKKTDLNKLVIHKLGMATSPTDSPRSARADVSNLSE